MATSSDSKIIDRESLVKTLEQRYATQKAGGAFNVQKDVRTVGSNEISLGGSTFDKIYTETKGFKIKMITGKSEFKDVKDGKNSSEQSLYLKGFNSIPYKK